MKINSLNLLLIAIFLFRLFLFNLPSFHIDMGDWEAWSYKLVSQGSLNFYSNSFFSDYFPGYLYVLWIIGEIYHFVFPNLSFANFNFEVLIKFITTVFDFGTAYLIYKIIKKHSGKFSKIAALLYLLNPSVIFNSSIWGQIDGVFTFFLVCSSYLLIERKKPLKASFLSSLAFFIKPQALAFYPILLFTVLKSSKQYLLYVILIMISVPIIFSVPFFGTYPFSGLINLAKKSADVYPYTSLYAYNFWGIFGWWKPDNINFLIFSYKNWGFILYLTAQTLILFPLIENKLNSKYLYFSSSLSLMAFYVFLPRMHERYLFPFLAFILIASFLNKSRLLIGMYLFISIIHFLNLWYVYYFYDFVYNNPNMGSSILYSFYKLLDNNGNTLSLLIVLSFILLLVFYYKSIYAKNYK